MCQLESIGDLVLRIQARPVQVVDAGDDSCLEDFGEPVLFRGMQRGWPAGTSWSADFFAERYGDAPVPVRSYPPGSEYEFSVERDTLGNYLNYWRETDPDPDCAGRRLYLAEWNFTRDYPELSDFFQIPALFSDDWIDRLPEQVRFGRMWLFFGEPGCSTGLHTDTFSTSAWLAMIFGRKALRLLHPSRSGALARGDSLWDEKTLSRILPDGDTGLLLEVVLGPGETLYIPGDWYHEVRNLDRNLMLTANFAEERRLLSFLERFESRLTEPLTRLRELRNEHVRRWRERECRTSELDSAEFRDRQLVWTDEVTAGLTDYRRTLTGLGH
ncbi:cupin-like domain-containing protein [Streptosporangium sp. NPDC023615]|uniref:cupin-like domain-containing protein n=1 Tax=Streptosporangium sp. NPDC023615 TaxID=3154794 RepID=UPI00341A36AB